MYSWGGGGICYTILMPDYIHNVGYLRPARRTLRNNLTPEEAILWNLLKNNKLNYKFRRQHSTGNFVIDFYCATKRLAIELDGSQHLDNIEHDQERTNYLENLGIKVIRFWNGDIKNNLDGVLMKIKEKLGK
jgi:very-short-patch-repair endonuclease